MDITDNLRLYSSLLYSSFSYDYLVYNDNLNDQGVVFYLGAPKESVGNGPSRTLVWFFRSGSNIPLTTYVTISRNINRPDKKNGCNDKVNPK